jgi:predicted thioesterase
MIGEGTHERTIINVAKFAARLAEKMEAQNAKQKKT